MDRFSQFDGNRVVFSNVTKRLMHVLDVGLNFSRPSASSWRHIMCNNKAFVQENNLVIIVASTLALKPPITATIVC